MTRQGLTGWAIAAACAAVIAAPLAAQAQMAIYPPPMYPQQMLPTYPQPMPPGERVFSYEGQPLVSPGDLPGNWDARQNVRESRQYEALVRSNPAFRARRIEQECGPIADPQGQDQCLSTFDYGDER